MALSEKSETFRGHALLLLQAEFADAGADLVQRLRDDLVEFGRRRRDREAYTLLDHRAVFRRGDDGNEVAVQQVDDGLRRAGAGADAEPAEAHEIEALLRQR